MPYNIDETLASGDPLHVEHHIALADAVNDLDARANPATTTSTGVVELATTGETTTGTDTARAVTPAGVKAVSDIINPWTHGIFPRVVYASSAWPSRASIVPSGYTGPVEFYSPYEVVTAPSDRQVNDIWTRKVS